MSDTPQVIGKPLPEHLKPEVLNKPDWLKFIRRPTKKARSITITGEAGLGKTSLAVFFEKPIFVSVEESEATLEKYADRVGLWPKITNTNDVIEALTYLGTDVHPFKTVVIDTVSRLYFMKESELVEKYGKTINNLDGGFGAGYNHIADFMRKIRSLCKNITDKGINVVFIAHTEIEKFSPPIGDPYNRYVLKMHEDSAVPFVDDVDCVAFIKLSTIINKEKNQNIGKAYTTGELIISCIPNPAHPITKNRFGIKEDLIYIENTNPLEKYL